MEKSIKALLIIILIQMCVLFILFCLLISYADAQTMTCVVHKGECVWIRDQPARTGNQIGSIRYGYEVEVSEIVNQYAHITFNGVNGWADIQYLELPIKETVYTVVSDGPLNKRETPDGRYLGRLKPGVRVSVLGWRYSPSGELWAKVYKGGYVAARYLALQ